MLHKRNICLIIRIQTPVETANKIGQYEQSSDQFHRSDPVCHFRHRFLLGIYRWGLVNVRISRLPRWLYYLHDSLCSAQEMNALALGMVAALCWGFQDICIRFFSQRTPVSACIFTVLLTGLVFQSGVTLATGTFQTLPAEAVRYALAAGFCFVFATFGLFYAFQRGPVRLVAPTVASYPILSLTLAAIEGVPISFAQLLAVICIITGVGSVAALSDTSDDNTPGKGITILLAGMSAAGFALTFALGQRAAELSHEHPTTLLARVFAFALIAAIFLVLKKPIWPGKTALPWLMAMGVADGVALLSVFSAGALPDAQYASVTSSLFGLMTILLAWLFLKERMTLSQWAGCFLAFAGVGYLAS